MAEHHWLRAQEEERLSAGPVKFAESGEGPPPSICSGGVWLPVLAPVCLWNSLVCVLGGVLSWGLLAVRLGSHHAL